MLKNLDRSINGAWMLLCAAVLLGCSVFAPGGPPIAADPPGEQAASPPALTTPAAAPTAELNTPAPTPTPDFKPVTVAAKDCSYGGAFRSIEAVAADEVRFSLCRPDVAFLSKIAFPAFSVYPGEWLAQAGTDGFSPDAPVGSGAFRLDEWVRGERLVLSAFDGYWQPGRPILDEVVFRWQIDPSTRLVELQAGTADGIDAVTYGDYETVRGDSSRVLLERPALNVAYLGMNVTAPPFDNVLVRRALAAGIDRQRLVAEAFPAGYEAASYFTPCSIPSACGGEPFPDFDVESARALLAEAGFPDGFQTVIRYRPLVRAYLPWPEQAAKQLQAQLKENLNIQARLETVDEKDFYSTLDAGALDGLYLLGWGADYPDADNFLGAHFGLRATRQFGPPIEALVAPVERAAAVFDPQQRAAAYAVANTILSEQAPAVPLVHGGWVSPSSRAAAFSAQVQGAAAGPFGWDDFSELSLLDRSSLNWLQAAEPLTLFCPFAEEGDSLQACTQIAEPLYRFSPGGAAVEPALAESCTPDDDLTTWTCTLRRDVRFHDGTLLDAGDVVASFAAQWDADSPLHRLDGGSFAYFEQFWPGFLNADTPDL